MLLPAQDYGKHKMKPRYFWHAKHGVASKGEGFFFFLSQRFSGSCQGFVEKLESVSSGYLKEKGVGRELDPLSAC